MKALFIYLIICFITDTTALFMVFVKIKTDFLENIFIVLEAAILSYIYYHMSNTQKIKKIIITIFIIFIILVFIFFVLKDGYYRRDYIVNTFECCIMILFSCYFFYKLLRERRIEKLENYYFYWINAGFLLYFYTTFFLSLFDNFILHCDITIGQILWGFHIIAYITNNIFNAIGIWKIKTIQQFL